MTDTANLPYRPCVGVMLVDHRGKVFVGKRIEMREGDAWQMPQGGIDEGEDVMIAAVRELYEETGVAPDQVQWLAVAREERFYELPDALIGKLWDGEYRGQRQMWLLARLIADDSAINLAAHDPAEFCEWKWVEPSELPDLIVPFKREVYASVVAEFSPAIADFHQSATRGP